MPTPTLGARDFSSAVSGFSQVFIVTRAESFFFFSRGFAARGFGLWPLADSENSRRTREKPLVPGVTYTEEEAQNVNCYLLDKQK